MTDVADAADFHLSTINNSSSFFSEIVDEDKWNLPFKTNHEEFCISKNIAFTRIICRKK
jgi:hypothetical protein